MQRKKKLNAKIEKLHDTIRKRLTWFILTLLGYINYRLANQVFDFLKSNKTCKQTVYSSCKRPKSQINYEREVLKKIHKEENNIFYEVPKFIKLFEELNK